MTHNDDDNDNYNWALWVLVIIILVIAIVWWISTWWSTPSLSQNPFNVTLVEKNNTHPFFGQGSQLGYAINGQQGVTLTLKRGQTYTFNVNTPGHPFYFSTSAVGNSNGQGNIGVPSTPIEEGTFQWTPTGNEPQPLWYQCAIHERMGGSVIIS